MDTIIRNVGDKAYTVGRNGEWDMKGILVYDGENNVCIVPIGRNVIWRSGIFHISKESAIELAKALIKYGETKSGGDKAEGSKSPEIPEGAAIGDTAIDRRDGEGQPDSLHGVSPLHETAQ